MATLTVSNGVPSSVSAERSKEGAALRPRPRTGALLAAMVAIVLLSSLTPALASAPVGTDDGLLDPLSIPKYVNQLPGPPPVYVPTVVEDGHGNVVSHDYTVTVTAFDQQILPAGFPRTPVWGYGGEAQDAIAGESLGPISNSPGPSFEAVRGIPINVKWVNDIDTAHMFAVDPTLHWADPNNLMMENDQPGQSYDPYPPGYPLAQAPVPLVTHLHGGEVESSFDGGPLAWWTYDGVHGPNYRTAAPTDPNAAVYHYPNEQMATTLWYHDHALGITRINVMSGLAGFYLLRDPNDAIAPLLPSGKYEIPLAIQDRTFNADGSFFFPSVGVNPDVHPYWQPEFFGNTIMVNGLVWPNLNVDRGVYRFRLLDGSNARFYDLFLSNGMPFTVIGSDGGYLRSAVTAPRIRIAPGERVDILVDFSSLAPGTKVRLLNTAKAPFPTGSAADPRTVGQIMQFTVGDAAGAAMPALPPILNPTLDPFPSLPSPTTSRILVLFEKEGALGSVEVLLNGQNWDAPVSETPTVGSTEDWIVVDLTNDAHPIHLHLVQFQLVSRQKIAADRYLSAWLAANGEPPFMFTPTEVSLAGYLRGTAKGPTPLEQAWKDTIQMFPGEVTVIRVRFAPQEGGSYPFDATQGPGYVWHCHILDHEDNEMMRPYQVTSAP